MVHDNSSLFLSQYDNLYAKIYLPTILYLGILMLFGITGNSFVCIVYFFKFKPSSTRCFILAMGILDLLNCASSIPLQILELSYATRFGEFGLCQVVVMCVTFCSMSSATVLLAVAVDRYRKICQFFREQISPEKAKIVCIICCVLSALFSTPTAAIYGHGSVPLDSANATVCTARDNFYHLLYTGTQTLIFLAASITLFVLYSLIWVQIRRQQVVRRRLSRSISSDKSKLTCHSSNDNDERSTQITSTGCSCYSFTKRDDPSRRDSQQAEYHKKDETLNIPVQQDHPPQHRENPSADESSESSPNSVFERNVSSYRFTLVKHQPISDNRKQVTVRSKHTGSKKVTFMLFLTTLVFIISYLPYLAIMAAAAVDDTVLANFRALSGILERSYFVQSVCNPVIYSFFNANFRRHLKRVVFRKGRQ